MNYSLNNCLLHLYLFVLFSTDFYSWKYHCWYLLVLLHASKTIFGLPVVFSVAMQSPFDLFFSWNVFPSVWGIFIQIARAGGFTFFPLHITAAISPELSSLKWEFKLQDYWEKIPFSQCRAQIAKCIEDAPSSWIRRTGFLPARDNRTCQPHR